MAKITEDFAESIIAKYEKELSLKQIAWTPNRNMIDQVKRQKPQMVLESRESTIITIIPKGAIPIIFVDVKAFKNKDRFRLMKLLKFHAFFIKYPAKNNLIWADSF